ncbi:Protein fam72a [Chytridiales sp. JEL 0842]|nr:Protein fam72a [Chytridiales sp. JEL 0842]
MSQALTVSEASRLNEHGNESSANLTTSTSSIAQIVPSSSVATPPATPPPTTGGDGLGAHNVNIRPFSTNYNLSSASQRMFRLVNAAALAHFSRQLSEELSLIQNLPYGHNPSDQDSSSGVSTTVSVDRGVSVRSDSEVRQTSANQSATTQTTTPISSPTRTSANAGTSTRLASAENAESQTVSNQTVSASTSTESPSSESTGVNTSTVVTNPTPTTSSFLERNRLAATLFSSPGFGGPPPLSAPSGHSISNVLSTTSMMNRRNLTMRNQFRGKVVCNLRCGECEMVVCQRGMKAILLADTNVELYSTDLPPKCTALVNEDYMTRNCQCRIRDVACLNCGSVIGYHVTQPCESCMSSCNNGHFFMFNADQVKSSDRMSSDGTKALLWADLPRAEKDVEKVGLYDRMCR